MAELSFIDPKNLVIVGLDTDDGAMHPLYDERIKLELNQSLVTSILVYGVRVPVLVREEDGKILVVDGRQRVRAAREAGDRDPGQRPKVPIVVQHGDDKRMSAVMTLVNEQRVDDPILAKAERAVRLLERLGDEEMVAVVFGRSVQTIRNWLILMKADPRIHEAIRNNIIATSAGINLARLDRAKQGEALEELFKAAKVEEGQDPGAKAALNAALDRQITEREVKEKRTRDGDAKEQKGIKRTWLRKALKTKAAETLSDDQRGVLEWIVEGGTEAKDAWWDTFWWEATQEMDG